MESLEIKIISRQLRSIYEKIEDEFPALEDLLKHFDSTHSNYLDSHTVRMSSGNIAERYGIYTGKHLRDRIFLNSAASYHKLHNESVLNTFRCLFNELHVDLDKKQSLELGPGYGESLEVMRERGASGAEFVDYNPYFVLLLRLKGYVGYMFNYLLEREFRKNIPQGKKYDVIMSRGSINSDTIKSSYDQWNFDLWLRQLDNYSKGTIIICPTFDRGNDDKPYQCVDRESFEKSMFFNSMRRGGYQQKWVNGFNDEVVFPYTFIKENTWKN